MDPYFLIFLRGVLLVLIIPFLGWTSVTHAQVGRHLPFQEGETLTYSITLLGIPAGRATMNVEPLVWVENQPRLRLVTTATSNDFVSLFFPVKNAVDSHLNADTMLPEHLIFHRHEGSRHEDFDVTFNHQAGQVTIQKEGQIHTVDIPPLTHDPLSCLYYLRRVQDLTPGQELQFTIHHDKKNYEARVQVETTEDLTGPWGNIETTRVLIIMPFRGIFSNEGNIRVWLANNATRVPLKMEARVIVGSVEALLEHSQVP